MRTFPKKVIAIFLGTLLAEIFFLIPVSAQEAPVAACAWEQQSTYYDAGTRQQITTSCSEGKDIFPDSNCLEAKPTYPSSIYTASKAICCCPKGATANSGQTEIEPPKFKIPELQVNFGVNFSAPDCDTANGETECKINWLGEYLTAIYNYALKIGGILATVMLMAGGIMWLISGGDVGKIGTAKDIISGSIIGLVLLFSSFLIFLKIPQRSKNI